MGGVWWIHMGSSAREPSRRQTVGTQSLVQSRRLQKAGKSSCCAQHRAAGHTQDARVSHRQVRAPESVQPSPCSEDGRGGGRATSFKLGATLSALGCLGEKAPGASPGSQRRGAGGILLGSLDPTICLGDGAGRHHLLPT